VSDGKRERELLLVGTLVVGRDPACEISEDGDSLLSRRHAEFVVGPDGVVVRDLGSRNGTFVNGVRIAEGPVRAGDMVHIGHLRLRYVEDDSPAAAAVASVAASAEDDEVTRIVSAARPAPRPEPPPPPRGVPPPHDDSPTLLTAPAPAASHPTAPRSPSSDEERTLLVPSARHAGIPAAAVPEPPPVATAPAVASASSARTTPGGLSAFVSLQIGAVAAIIFVAVALSFTMGRSELFGEAVGGAALFKWLVPPLAVAFVATFVASRAINRRMARMLTADKEEGPEV
jgi:predicted component of type VI protein secretion system